MRTTAIKCVIVAAGSSTRLRPLTDMLPKCLLPLAGKTILQRTIENLLGAKITKIAIVIGFEGERIRSFLKHQFPSLRIHCILNPNFATTNNAYSLLLARDFFLESKSKEKKDDRLLVLDSDIIFHEGVLQLLERNSDENRLAVRANGPHDAEEVRVCIGEAGCISMIGKNVLPAQSYGESVGIELLKHESALVLFEVLKRRIAAKGGRTEYYEAAFQEMIDAGVKITAVDVSEFPTIEIDSPADLEFAERVIIPSIDSRSNVRV